MLILLGLMVGLVSIYFHGQDVKQRECIGENFSDFATVLNVRGDLSGREAAANQSESAATRQLIIDAFASKDRQEAFAAFRKAQKAWKKVDRQRAAIAKARADNPIPNFPEGACS